MATLRGPDLVLATNTKRHLQPSVTRERMLLSALPRTDSYYDSPPPKTAILFNERFMATRHEE